MSPLQQTATFKELRAETDDQLTTKQVAERQRYLQEMQDAIRKMTTEIQYVEKEYARCKDDTEKLCGDRCRAC